MKTSQLCKANACCGCGACAAICPKNAISMAEDRYGFLYPRIDESKCIHCGACERVCSFSTEKKNHCVTCYACVNKSEDQIMRSASGGAFSAIAAAFLKSGGFVCGAAAVVKDGVVTVEHKVIDKPDDLPELQGSKYVQSDTLPAFKEIQKLLKEGNKVLFSGTPCQVDAIKSLCGKYAGTTLFTMDIICHGVPSQKFFNSYLDIFQKRRRAQLTYIDFRNKKYGWGKTGVAEFSNARKSILTPENSSYYAYFMESEISRENCYHCPYANMNRVGDITIGDYWGAAEFSKDFIEKYNLSEEKGISCLIVNHENGKKLLDEFADNLLLYPIDVQKAAIYNTQLREPARHTAKRDWLMETFADKGYAPIEKAFQRQLFFTRFKRGIKRMIPKPVRNTIRKALKGK